MVICPYIGETFFFLSRSQWTHVNFQGFLSNVTLQYCVHQLKIIQFAMAKWKYEYSKNWFGYDQLNRLKWGEHLLIFKVFDIRCYNPRCNRGKNYTKLVNSSNVYCTPPMTISLVWCCDTSKDELQVLPCLWFSFLRVPNFLNNGALLNTCLTPMAVKCLLHWNTAVHGQTIT